MSVTHVFQVPAKGSTGWLLSGAAPGGGAHIPTPVGIWPSKWL